MHGLGRLFFYTMICTKVEFTVIGIYIAWRLPCGVSYKLRLLPTVSPLEHQRADILFNTVATFATVDSEIFIVWKVEGALKFATLRIRTFII